MRKPLLNILLVAGLLLSGYLTIPGGDQRPVRNAPGENSARLYLPFLTSVRGPEPSSATSSGPIAFVPQRGEVWVANPDAGSVSAIDAYTGSKMVEVEVGDEPWSLASAPHGETLYVVDRAMGTLVVIDAPGRKVAARIPVGPEPGAVVLDPMGKRAYVTLTTADAVAVVDTAQRAVTARIPVAARPYAAAISGKKDAYRLYVTHLLALPRSEGKGGGEGSNDGRKGLITVIDGANNRVRDVIELFPNQHGFPNFLTSILIDGERAWAPHVRQMPAQPHTLSTTVFAAVSTLDLVAGVEHLRAYLPLNDEEIFGSPVNNPVAAALAPDGNTLYIVLAGSNLVEVVDISTPEAPRLVRFLPTGHNPRGITLSPDGRWGYVMNFLSRSITVLDLAHLAPVAEIPVTEETLDAEILRGKILFDNASDPRLSRSSWVSCASCHFDGWTDGVTWMMEDGPRQTPQLWNAGDTLPWHWSATLDEPHDVEDTIQSLQHGLGLAPGPDPPLLGPPNAGRSADLDALAAYLTRGFRSPVIPNAGDGAEQGRELFKSSGCAECHGGPQWTASRLPGPPGTLDPNNSGMIEAVLRDVGTLNAHDVRGAEGFVPPSLLAVGVTAPYFHDGSMPTLEALLASGHPQPHSPAHREPLGRGAEIDALAAFLRSIDAQTQPVHETTLSDNPNRATSDWRE